MMKTNLLTLLVCVSLWGKEPLTFQLTASHEVLGLTGITRSLTCKQDAKFETGERLRCGTSRPYLEILRTYGNKEGAAVLFTEKNGEKVSRFFNCEWNEPFAGECEESFSFEDRDTNALYSPILKSIAGSSIRNSHWVGKTYPEVVMRGMQPRTESDYQTLEKQGVHSVLIFKNEVRGDNRVEQEKLRQMGYSEEAILTIPFGWKSFRNFRSPCEHAVSGLKFLLESVRENRKVFFHCTVGEDRTGFLAGMFRLLTEKETAQKIFQEEMCERGYSYGNPMKPFNDVVLEIHQSLDVLYRKMAYLNKIGKLTADKLDESVCRHDPAEEQAFIDDPEFKSSRFLCRSSTRFRPE